MPNNTKLPPKADLSPRLMSHGFKPRAEKFAIVFSIIFFGILFFARSSLAAPNISSFSGSVSDGQNITISGSGFGANGPTIVLFDDFEKGTNGSVVSTATGSAQIGNWTGSNGSGLTTYSNECAHGGTRCMKNNWDTSVSEPGNQMQLQFNGATEVFYSFWTTVPSGKNVPGTPTAKYPTMTAGPNWKLAWIWDNRNGTPNFQEYLVVEVLQANLPSIYTQWFATNTSGRDRGGEVGDHMTKGEWSRFDLYQKGGVSNGILQGWETDFTHGMIQKINKNNVTTLADGTSWNTITMPGYARGQTENGVTVYDDVYFATGPGARARVEIGDAPAYNNCHNLSISTVTSWSDTLVTAIVRQGSFTSGQTAYLYVFDANGSVNTNGYPITIGGGSAPDTTPPTISLTAPSAGSTVSGTAVSISANASDNVGVAGVQFKLDGANLGSEDTSSPYSITWNTTQATNGSHTLTATARDAANNQTTSSGVSATVSNATSDTQTPTIPTNLTASAISSSQINLSWTASTDPSPSSGLAGYRIYRCAGSGCTATTQITTSATNSYSDSDLTANTTYVYRLKAYDNATNESGYSSSASATTQTTGAEGTNLALNKSVTATRADWGTTASLMVDGIKDGSYWAAQGVPNSLTVDLGADYSINKIYIGPYGVSGSTCYYENAWNVKFKNSSDTTWRDFTSATKQTGLGTLSGPGISITNGRPAFSTCDNNYKYYNFIFSPVTARYIRYEVTGGDVDGDSNGDEIEVYSTTGDTTPPAAPTGVIVQ